MHHGSRRPRLVASLVATLLGTSAIARAQEEPSASQRQGAAEAYDRGTASLLARDYARAAEWFETANRLAPSAPALIQAIRAHQRSHDDLRAGSLAIRLNDQFHDAASRRAAERVLREAQPRYLRVDVVCTDCTIDLDGTLQEYPSFFLPPSTEHRIVAHFSTGERDETITGRAGERRELRFEAPPPREEPAASATPVIGTAATRGNASASRERRRRSGGGLPPAVAIIGLGVTVVLGGITTWSGLDTMDGVPAYEANPTAEALEAGQAKEFRTNILITATAAVGVATIVLALFATDWDGDDDAEEGERGAAGEGVRAALAPAPDGAAAIVTGRF